MKKEIGEFLTPQRLKKEFKEEEWTDLFYNIVDPILTTYIEYALGEWLQLNITIGSGKKKKTVSLTGR